MEPNRQERNLARIWRGSRLCRGDEWRLSDKPLPERAESHGSAEQRGDESGREELQKRDHQPLRFLFMCLDEAALDRDLDETRCPSAC
jgi:hypothetical protein